MLVEGGQSGEGRLTSGRVVHSGHAEGMLPGALRGSAVAVNQLVLLVGQRHLQLGPGHLHMHALQDAASLW